MATTLVDVGETHGLRAPYRNRVSGETFAIIRSQTGVLNLKEKGNTAKAVLENAIINPWVSPTSTKVIATLWLRFNE